MISSKPVSGQSRPERLQQLLCLPVDLGNDNVLYHSLSGYRWKREALLLPEHTCSSWPSSFDWIEPSHTVARTILRQLQWLARIYHSKLARCVGLALLVAYFALNIAISCHRFRSNLSLLAYNPGHLWRRLALPKRIENLVADQPATAACEDRRSAGEAYPLLLAAPSGRASEPPAVRGDAGPDCTPAGADGIASRWPSQSSKICLQQVAAEEVLQRWWLLSVLMRSWLTTSNVFLHQSLMLTKV